MNLDQMAKFYARKERWHLFPVIPKGKAPLTANGVKDATNDLKQISEWWERWPTANIGLATGRSGLVVVDIDDVDALAALSKPLPNTLAATTGGGGYHLFYKAPAWELRPSVGYLPGLGKTAGIDLRAGESYVILPPSVHPSGDFYNWVVGSPQEPAPCPTWLREQPKPEREAVEPANPTAYAAGALRNTLQRIKEASNGERNHTLNREVFSLRRFIQSGQLDQMTVYRESMKAAVAAGLSEYEAARTIQSALGGAI